MCLAIPGKIISLEDTDPIKRTGRIDFGGVVKSASLAYVPDAQIGQYVIVHAGFALSVLDESEANEVFRCLEEVQALL